MPIETVTAFFGWCTVINIGVLSVSTIAIIVGGKSIRKLHATLFGLEESALAPAYFQYLAQYKIVTLTLNLTPYLALKILA